MDDLFVRYPYSSVSIGFALDKQVVAAVVYNPMREEMFTAVRGGGAFLNQTQQLHVSNVKQASDVRGKMACVLLSLHNYCCYSQAIIIFPVAIFRISSYLKIVFLFFCLFVCLLYSSIVTFCLCLTGSPGAGQHKHWECTPHLARQHGHLYAAYSQHS